MFSPEVCESSTRTSILHKRSRSPFRLQQRASSFGRDIPPKNLHVRENSPRLEGVKSMGRVPQGAENRAHVEGSFPGFERKLQEMAMLEWAHASS